MRGVALSGGLTHDVPATTACAPWPPRHAVSPTVRDALAAHLGAGGDLAPAPGTAGLPGAAQPGTDGPAQPLLRAREHGGGRGVDDALGHHPASSEVAGHREIVRRAISWTTGG